jgi:hypothetical protein
LLKKTGSGGWKEGRRRETLMATNFKEVIVEIEGVTLAYWKKRSMLV